MSESALRVAYLVSHYPRANHTYILREVRGLRALGAHVEVLSVSPDDRPLDALTDDEREERALVFVVKDAGVAGTLGAQLSTLVRRPLAYLRGLAGAARLAGANPRALAYNVAYFAQAVVVGRRLEQRGLTHLHSHFSTTVGLLAARTFGLDLSMTVHGPAEFVDPDGQYIGAKVAAATLVVAISRFGRSQLMTSSAPEHWSKLEVVPLGVAPVAPAPRARVTGVPFTLLFVGELRPVKGVHVLVAALTRLVANGHDVALRVVGDGPMRASLEREVARHALGARVTFLGRVNQDAVRAEYASADAFVLPSFAEGVPVVLMEAMASGVPCVATRITGIPELIRDGEDGLLVTASDDAELAAAVERLIVDRALAGRLVDSARARVAERYDLVTNVRALADVFVRHVPPRPPAR